MKTKTSLIANRLAIGTFFLHLLITSSLLAQVPAYVPANGLVGYWPFNGNANDESGNGNHGTVNGATLTADRNGNANSAYGFQANNQHILIGENLNNGAEIGFPNTSWSVNAWFLNDGTNQLIIFSDYNSFAGNTNNGENDLIFSFLNQYNENIAYGSMRHFPSGDYGCQGNSIEINNWKMYSCIYSQGTISMYINGTLLCSTLYNNDLNYRESPVYRIGASMWNGNYAQSYGYLDDIAIYNRALTQEEITALYNGTTAISGCTNTAACNYNAAATQDDGSCTYPAQTYLNCAGTCINDADNDGTCDELETPTLPSYLPSNGLVGYWPFNGNANDESGNGNHGTVNGATLTADRNGNTNSAYSFDGVNDNIIIASDEILNVGTSDFSISIFFRSENLTNACLIGKRSYSLGNGYSIFLQNNALYGQLIDENSASQSPGCNFNTTENQWHHYVVTFDRDNNQLAYMDGIFCDYVGILDESGNIVNETDLFIGFFQPPGNDCWTGCYFFNGQLDDIAIYNRALTQEEITALYNGTTAISGCTNSTACNYNASATQDDGSCTYPAQTYLNCAGTCINDADNDGVCDELETPTLPSYIPSNGLVGYWPFNGNANDESGNGNHGTVNGTTLSADRNGSANSAYNFAGNPNSISVNQSNHPTGNVEISYSIWLNPSLLSTVDASAIICIGSISVGNGTSAIFCRSNNIYYTQGGNDVAFNYSLNINEWSHIAVTKTFSNQVKLFVNGVFISDQFTNPGQNIPTSKISFGFNGDDNHIQGEYFNGQLDDIAIYNRALTQEEITALYNGTTSGGGGGNGGTTGTPAQSVPQGIPYQAMIRDNIGAALMNTPVTVRFSLRQDAIDGTVEYQETHNLTTNTFGLVNTHFGSGTATQGTFANINWSNTTKFIQVEANTGSGFVEMGTQQMMSVPFALKANSANEANKVKNAGLPVYANNAAALAGGLVAGEMYRTATGDLKIVY